jgi:hypothetical protein
MLRRQIALAERLGFAELAAVVLAENAGMIRLLEHTPLHWTSTVESGVATWRAPLPAQEPQPRHAQS